MSIRLSYSLPDKPREECTFDTPTVLIGTLQSNHIVINASNIEPIHGILEEVTTNNWIITDLGSGVGISLNGRTIDVEAAIKPGDKIGIGPVEVKIESITTSSSAAPTVYSPSRKGAATESSDYSSTVKSPRAEASETKISSSSDSKTKVRKSSTTEASSSQESRKPLLFNPRSATPSGSTLEVVCFWNDTVLDIEHYYPKGKGKYKVTIGTPPESDFFIGTTKTVTAYPLAKVSSSGYAIKLVDKMKARIRKGGKIEEVSTRGVIQLGSRDIAHVKHGALNYFFLYINPPSLNFPANKIRDPFFAMLMTAAMLFYVALNVALLSIDAKEEEKDKDDIWSIVHIPEKKKPQPKPKPIEKPQVKVAEIKQEPPKTKLPPPPKPKPVKPTKPKVVEKVKQPKPVKQPVPEKTANPNQTLAKNDAKKAPENPTPKPNPELKKLGDIGMPSTGAKTPDFKLAGPKIADVKKGRAGGPKGSGNNQLGGARKGKQNASVMGVEGPKNNKASGMNLDKLGAGVGKVLSKNGAGAVYTKFKSSAGGAGGGMGSASKTYGLGGVGDSKSLGLSGSAGAINNFGSGAGGLLSGEGGSGGLGGKGLGKSFGGGRGRANVDLPPGDPLISGGLTQQEVMTVIRTHLNEIRHCYERLLQRSPNQSGKIAVNFVIATTGRVSSVKIERSDIRDAQMKGCVNGVIKRWKFPRPRGSQPVTVNYPFVFNPL